MKELRMMEIPSNSNWKLFEDGSISYKNYYHISANQLIGEDEWILHLSEKTWIDYNEFIPVYFNALQILGIEKKVMRIYYKEKKCE